MNLKILNTFIFLFFSVSLMAQTEPSEERSSFDQRKISIMDGNLLRATYHNTGHAGRRNSGSLNELIFEYPRNTGREYMYFMSVMYGTQVTNQNNPNSTLTLVNTAAYKTSANGRINYSLNPILGYARDDSEEIARSDRGPGSPLGNTWPEIWPDKLVDGGDGWAGSWNGFFGRDQFNADVEFYYKSGDDRYTQYSGSGAFRPDSTDPSRGGLGIILDTRVLAWSQTLVNATHFNIFEITNDASYDYPRMAFGLWIADFVGGGGPTDEPVFDNIRSIAYLTDTDRNSGGNAFDGGLIGEMGLKFLETPGNALDGIDNDGDADFYDPQNGQFYDPDNKDLFTRLTTAGGGFYSAIGLRDSVIKTFELSDFDERSISIGDKIVLIQEDGSRVIAEYDGSPFTSQGMTWDFGGATINIREDLIDPDDPPINNHTDGIDNDFDGLIDENRPNHLLKSTFTNTGASIVKAVRFINYLHFDVGDTLGRGLIVPNQDIRARMASDPAFEALVNDTYGGRLQNYFTSAPMIDESRADFFDNDNDWSANLDDVGIEGDPDTPSIGQGDGLATSGAGTPFPGEPNIDKTDVSETDLIGVSRVTIFDAGALQVNVDADVWNDYLEPGQFEEDPGTDSDIFVSSGLFPLERRASERFAVAVTAVQTNSPTPAGDRQQTNRNLDQATQAYEADYQFAVAPSPPIVTAVPSDGKVTLYWDTSSEESFDRYINRITGNGNDFEGYKVYRSTDDAFEDVFSITDAFGTPQLFRPIAIFDIENGISGLHPVPINGTQFNLGNDTGIRRVFEDTDVVNGRNYYYAVTAYDYGLEVANIAPSESPIQISRNPDGSVILGQNVVSVRPTRSEAGYIDPDNPQATLLSGSPGGTVTVDIIDPTELKGDNLYEVTFEDTLIDGGANQDTLRTKNFTLTNVTGGERDTLISRSDSFNGESNPVTEGFEVSLNNISLLALNTARSGWIYNHETEPHRYDFALWSVPKIADYELIIGDNVGFGQSTARRVEVVPGTFIDIPSVPTNFKVINTYEGVEVDYAFGDLHQDANAPAGVFSATSGILGLDTDIIILIEDFREFEDTLTYRFQLNPLVDGQTVTSVNPQPGDTLEIFTTKPFSSNDVFQFRMDPENLPRVDADSAASALDDILVVPNPYVVSNIYEAAITNTNRQQNRELHFTGLPSNSTLRIFTVSGVLIKEIQITDDNLVGPNGGTYIWNMLTKDNLEISYGIYLYHVDAPGVGQKTGKFAVIK